MRAIAIPGPNILLAALLSVALASCGLSTEPPDRRSVRDRSIPWDHPDRIGRWNPNAVHLNAVLSPIAISPATKQLAAAVGGTPQNEIQVLSYYTGHVTRIQYRSGYYRVSSPTFSPDGRLLAFIAAPPSWGGVSEVVLFDLEAGELVRTFGGPGEYIDQIRFARSGDGLHVFAIERSRAEHQPGPPYQHYREIQRDQFGFLSFETGLIEPLAPVLSSGGRILAESDPSGVWLRLTRGVDLLPDGQATLDEPDFCLSLGREWAMLSCSGIYFWNGDALIPFSPRENGLRPMTGLAEGRVLALVPASEADNDARQLVVCASPKFTNNVQCEAVASGAAEAIGSNPASSVLGDGLVSGVATIDRSDLNSTGGITVFENSSNLADALVFQWPDSCSLGRQKSTDHSICTLIGIE